MELKIFYIVQAILNLSLAGTYVLLKLADYHMHGTDSSFIQGHVWEPTVCGMCWGAVASALGSPQAVPCQQQHRRGSRGFLD